MSSSYWFLRKRPTRLELSDVGYDVQQIKDIRTRGFLGPNLRQDSYRSFERL